MEISTNIFIESSQNYKFKLLNKVFVKPNEMVTLIIDYPLSMPFSKIIKGGGKGLTGADIVDEVIKAYKIIYNNQDFYGVWGHNMGDLVLVSIERKRNKIYVGVDS
jgi:hypothetical protein